MRAATPLKGRQRSAIRSSLAASGRRFRFKASLRGFLQREVAGGEGVGMAEAEQEENVRRPRTHAFDRDQRLVGVLGVETAEAFKIEAALDDRLGEPRASARILAFDNPQARKSSSVALAISAASSGTMRACNRPKMAVGAGGRHLLRHDDRGESRKARLPAAKRRRAADRDQALDRAPGLWRAGARRLRASPASSSIGGPGW